MLQTMMLNNKKKNDERFTILTIKLEVLAQHNNDIKNKDTIIWDYNQQDIQDCLVFLDNIYC